MCRSEELIENRETILKLQATLTKIKTKKPVFFIVANFVKWGLVREHGTTSDNKTNWVLTARGQSFLDVVV